jgi:hypothetical protein
MDVSSLTKQVVALAKGLGKDTFTISDLWKATEPKPPDDVWYILRYVMVSAPDVFEKLSANKWSLKEVKNQQPKTVRSSRAGNNGGHPDERKPKKDRRSLAAAESTQAASAGS